MHEQGLTLWLEKLENYCAYQERCIQDVRRKMTRMKIPESDFSLLIQKLVEEKFIDEARYARAFLRSKVTNKRDGIQKIKYALKAKGISEAVIQEVFEDLDKSEYEDNLQNLLKKKWEILIQKNEKQDAKNKLIRFLLGKGYRYEEFKKWLSM